MIFGGLNGSVGRPCPNLSSDLSYLYDIWPFQAIAAYKNEDFLRRIYLSEGVSTVQIAKLTSSSRSTIMEYLKHFSIPIRPEATARKMRPGQAPFGKKLLKGGLVECKSEQDIIQRILKMRTAGKTYRAIAETLNNWGTPTKTQGSTWQAATVMKIERRNATRRVGVFSQ